MMGQQRRRFSPEFKRDAVALHKSSGRSIAAVAKELGIGESNLGGWLAKDREQRAMADPVGYAVEVAESEENKRLRRRVAEYFRATGCPQRGLRAMYVKTAVVLLWAVVSYVAPRSKSTSVFLPTSCAARAKLRTACVCEGCRSRSSIFSTR